jgi:hypothetical protein
MLRRLIVTLTLTGLVGLLAGTAATASSTDPGQRDLAEVRAATAPLHRVTAAESAGYQLLPGLDHCFENPGVGAMGFHYINPGVLDLDLDPRQPEALVYAPHDRGRLQLAAVEYIVPAEAWDAQHVEPPEVLGQHLHLNAGLGVYVLHAWIFKNNPAGIFEDWNPDVTC